MNRRVFVTGDTSTRDKLKLTGFIDAFSKMCETVYIPPSLKNQININGYCDILFGESGDWLDMPYDNVGSVFMWSVIDPDRLREIAKNNQNTKFFICSKSLIHDIDVSKEYTEKYTKTSYMENGIEGVDIKKFSDIISESEKVEKNLYRIGKNLFYLYLPCSLASENIQKSDSTRDIDVTYFGTRDNRPGVSAILNSLESGGYHVVYNSPNNYISPEQCIEYYKRSIITIHEQVGPVYLEFPVRFGEASYCGSKIFSLDRMENLQKYADSDPNVPSFKTFQSQDELMGEAINYINSYKNGMREIDAKEYTYEFYCRKIIRLSNEKI
jgi:hypothetical protein